MENYRRNSRSNLLSAVFQVSYLRLVHAYIHEIGHVYQTFLGHREQDTPPQAQGSRHDNEPEASEFFEKALIEGLLDFYNDKTPIGREVSIVLQDICFAYSRAYLKGRISLDYL